MLSKIPASLRFGLLAAISAALGLAVATMVLPSKVVNIQSGTLLQPPKAIPAFRLTDSAGQVFDNARLQGHWSVLFAGFTSCPDVCPTTLTLMKGVMADLGPQASRMQMVFLSVDPERDTPDRIAHYVQYFDPRFIGVTAPTAQLDPLALALGFVYAKVPGQTPDTYTMDHSAALMLINPQGQLAGYLTPPFKRAALVADLQKILQ